MKITLNNLIRPLTMIKINYVKIPLNYNLSETSAVKSYRVVRFLADRTNGRAIATVLRLSVCLL